MKRAIPVVSTREPGGTNLGSQLRHVLLNAANSTAITRQTELLLVFAARAQHLHEVIRPSIEAGKWVICDRFTDSTLAYQGTHDNETTDLIKHIAREIHGDFWPERTYLLDAPIATCRHRLAARGKLDRIESRDDSFFEIARRRYLELAREASDRIVIIDATQSLPAVVEKVCLDLAELLRRER